MKPAEPPISPRSQSGERSRLAQRLRRVVRGEVLFDAASRGRYATDASIYRVEPVGVVVPVDEADLLAALELARELGVPVVPRGAGSSQCGQALGSGLVIDTSRHLNRILAFDPAARTVEVQPGIVLDRLNAHLAPAGLWFPVDVCSSAQATLGGMAGNNASGVRSVVYGNMVHNVVGIDAILADGTLEHFGPFGVGATRALGSARASAMVSRLFQLAAREREEIERVWPRVLRRVGGYNLDVFHPVSVRPYTGDGSVNLAHLLVGSEGTLAHFRRLHLKLAPLPGHRLLAVLSFPSLPAAIAAVPEIASLGPSAVELLDASMLVPLRGVRTLRPLVDTLLAGRPAALLLVEFAGDERGPLLRRLRALEEGVAGPGAQAAFLEVADPGRQRLVWALHRAAIEGALVGVGARRPVSFIDECAVPLPRLAEYVEAIEETMRRHRVAGVWHGRASVGALSLRPLLALRAGEAAKMRPIAEEAAALVRRFGGAFSGGRGDGLAGSEWIERDFGPRLARAFEEVKAIFDPDGLMNPGKIVRPLRMDDGVRMRVAPGSARAPADGVEAAVARCDGNGRCRALDSGAMCPSYRITLDERDSPRGRVNTLRLALEGRFGPEGVGASEVAQAMALCVSCKACRSECPSAVDVARLKIEALSRRTRTLSRGERLFASLPAWAPMASRLPWLPNLRDRVPGMAALTGRLLGLARRPLPRWRRDTFLRAWSQRAQLGQGRGAPAADGEGRVVLFADCFSNHFEPEVPHAAVRVLEAAGLRVEVARPAPNDPQPGRPLCCGRSYLSAGLLDRARAEAARTVAALAPLIEEGADVVGLEPACLLTMRDEFRWLGLGDAAQALAGRALLFEEFLVRERAARRPMPAFLTSPWQRALLHGHCHQQAFDAVPDLVQVLSWVPGLEVASAPAGCCGMGDGFGYRADGHGASLRMGELGLLPAVRDADASTVIVSDGFGCRRQIADGAQRGALHVARVLEAALPAGAASAD
jgi:FAD/FMN-containing dehydrogenase/Fe-S oxidoreductase